MGGQDDKKSKHNQTLFWRGVLSLLALVIGYSLYSGVSLKKIEVPGVFNAEFSPSADSHDNHAPTPDVSPASDASAILASVAPSVQPSLPPASPEVALARVPSPAETTGHVRHETVTTAPVSSPVERNVSGIWFSNEGLQYNIIHQGNDITLQEINPLLGGMITAEGEGEIDGRQIDMELNTLLGIAGSAELEVSLDGQRIQGTYTAEGSFDSMPLQLYRQN